MIASWRQKLNRKLGETLFLRTQRDYVTGQLDRRPPVALLVHGVATLVLFFPLALLVGGIVLLLTDFPNLLTGFLGGILIFAAIWLRPRRPEPLADLLTESDLPETMKLIRSIAQELEAPEVDAVHVTNDCNASIFQNRGNIIVGIGTLLWESLDIEEKAAVLAHEMAHLVNGDPARGAYVGSALQVLSGWVELLRPDECFDAETNTIHANIGLEEMVGNSIVLAPVAFLLWVLQRLNYYPQQRAEYLADALAAKIAGPRPIIRALGKLAVGIRQSDFGKLHIDGNADGREIIAKLAKPLRNLDPEILRKALKDAAKAGLAVDGSHPPTHLRIAFVEGLPNNRTLTLGDIDAEALESEWNPVLGKLGRQLVRQFEVQ